MSGNVYFVQEGADGCIKIGWTSGDPINRLRAFQVGNSSTLTLLGAYPAPIDTEAGWHVRFSASCKRSEWFYPTTDLLDAIKTACFAGPQQPPEPPLWDANGQDVLDWLKRNNVSMSQLAEGMGYGLAHVANCLEGSRNSISPRMAHRIEKFTNGELTAESFLAAPRAAAAERKAERDEWVRQQYANVASQIAAIQKEAVPSAA